MVIGQYLFKRASLAINSTQVDISLIPKILFQAEFIIGCILYATATFMWIALLKRLSLSVAYPLTIGLSIIFTGLMSFVIFLEPIKATKIIAYVFIIVAILLLSRGA